MKRPCEFNFTQRILLNLIWAIEKSIYKRKWTYRDQVYHAMININEDAQWMSHNKIASSVCHRHSAMIKDSWYKTSHLSQDSFRDSIGLNPHHKNKREVK